MEKNIMLLASDRNTREVFVFFILLQWYHLSENDENIGFDSSILKGTAFYINVLELIHLDQNNEILASNYIFLRYSVSFDFLSNSMILNDS